MMENSESLERTIGLGVAAPSTAVPGDPQHSCWNLLKAGFRETYARGNFTPQPPSPQ